MTDNRLIAALDFLCLNCGAAADHPCVMSSGRPYRRGGYVHHDRLTQAIRAERGDTGPHEPSHDERAGR